MPTNVVKLDNSKKHYTKAEREARQKAESKYARERVRLTPPERLQIDPEALRYWEETVRLAEGIGLFDDLDADMLAIYCEMLSRRDTLQAMMRTSPTWEDILKSLQAQERLIASYAEKLGLTPNARARLAKKTAEEPKENKFAKFGV